MRAGLRPAPTTGIINMALQYPTSASKRVRLLRRISQALFLSAFVLLLYLTEFSFTSSKNPDQTILPSPLLKLFFDIDPLSGIATGISSWVIYGGLLLSLIVILTTIFFGRFFCGWVCPLGTINQMCSSFPSERDSRKGKRLIESNIYHKYQAWKYYILVGLLASPTATRAWSDIARSSSPSAR